MIDIIPASERHFADHGWLKTHYLFSFADYYDPANIEFGALRVFNDDIVAPGAGFPPHPHAEMEIVTIILEGEITHEDSMGTRETIGEGEVQAMTAGAGVVHSEFNLGEKSLHLYQIWIRPRKAKLPNAYGQKKFKPNQWKNKLAALASGKGAPGALKINADATIYRCELEEGNKLSYNTNGRRTFVYLADGELSINGKTTKKNEQARIEGEGKLELAAKKTASFVLIDVA
ncbi:MAG: pirin family protein [Candidatus Anstonellaceae archaeon]